MKNKTILFHILFFLFVTAGSAKSMDKLGIDSVDAKMELLNKLFAEKDGSKAELISQQIVHQIDTDTSWSSEKPKREVFRVHPLHVYLVSEDIEGFKKYLSTLGDVRQNERIHFISARYVLLLIQQDRDLDFAVELMDKERAWALEKMNQSNNRPDSKAESSYRTLLYAQFTNYKARLLYARGDKAGALELSNEAMKHNALSKDEGIINFYVEMISYSYSDEQLQRELESLFIRGLSTPQVLTKLKDLYVQSGKEQDQFDQYLMTLNSDVLSEKIKMLKGKMLDEPAPDFRLKDLDGNTVDLKDLKGKTIILDFWAMWCGPCKASFPAMQTMVNKYKDDPDVVFLFIDCFEVKEEKEQIARDYIKSNNFAFQVLMDNDDQVAKTYKVASIPAKIIIDKTGIIRFRSAGFASDSDLMAEIDAMIILSKNDKM